MIEVKFYSEHDMSCGYEVGNIISNIANGSYSSINSIKDLINFFNTIKFLNIDSFQSYIENNTGIKVSDLKKNLNSKVGRYLSINEKRIVALFEDLDFTDTEDYFEILEKYKLYINITESDFFELSKKENFFVLNALKQEKITNKFDNLLSSILLDEPQYIDSILNKYISDTQLFLPHSLNESNIIDLCDRYINIPNLNTNVLKKIINFPTNRGLILPDITKLNAKRRLDIENENLLKSGNSFVSNIVFSCQSDLDESIKYKYDGLDTEITVNLDWIKENSDYPTLWNNFIYLFSLVDHQGRILTISKKNGQSPIENLFTPTGNHLYRTTRKFKYYEMFFSVIIRGYIECLDRLDISIEEMLSWFFKVYLKEEFSIEHFEIYTPTKTTPYFEKCAAILPELDRIFKQYNSLIDYGKIDPELIQMSSFSYMTNQIKSLNNRKYVYPKGEWFEKIAFLLFSDQSGIFYTIEHKSKFKNFFELVTSVRVSESQFKQFQLQRINVLIEEKLLSKDKNNYYIFNDNKLIFLLKELYYEDVLSYWHLSKDLRYTIDSLYDKGKIEFESTLLSRNEQDYLDFYLNRSKFSNGYDIRNKFAHGSSIVDETKSETTYFEILKLFILIVLKVNDDIIIKNYYSIN